VAPVDVSPDLDTPVDAGYTMWRCPTRAPTPKYPRPCVSLRNRALFPPMVTFGRCERSIMRDAQRWFCASWARTRCVFMSSRPSPTFTLYKFGRSGAGVRLWNVAGVALRATRRQHGTNQCGQPPMEVIEAGRDGSNQLVRNVAECAIHRRRGHAVKWRVSVFVLMVSGRHCCSSGV